MMTKKIIIFILSFCVVLFCTGQQRHYPVPTVEQIGWHEAEIGVVFHYDLHVFDHAIYNQSVNRIAPVADYNIFNPGRLNTDQWVLSAKHAGAKFAVLTATHETGFALYQSDVNPYCLKAVRWQDGKGDIVRDFVNSCRKYGVKPGIYIGIRWNSLYGIHNFKAEGEGEFARKRQQWYKRMCEKMVEEICTRYGDLFLIWFDGGADDPAGDGPDVLPIVMKYQPHCLFYHNVQRADFRWGGSESGMVEYPCWSSFPQPYSHHKQTDTQRDHLQLLKHGDPEGQYWLPAMADTPLRGANGRHEWFWEPGDEMAVYPKSHLIDIYYNSVGRNATLILGLTPDPDGLIPGGDSIRLQEFGESVRNLFGNPLNTVAGKGKQIELKLPAMCEVSECMIQEDIRFGERIRQYRVEAKVNGAWQTMCEGESVGYKRIQKFNRIKTRQLRLVVEQSVDVPLVHNFSVYNN